MWSMASEEPRAGRMRGLRQTFARGLTYRAMCILWTYRNMQKVMDSDWRRPPGYCVMKRLKRKSPGYCAMRRLKRRLADILAKLPMHQTKSRVTAGRQSLQLRTIWRTTQRQFFFQMLRGSGAKGLAGMHPVSVKNGVTYIRPLLSATRAQIEEYLKENGQAFVTDATNTDTAYSRNKLRHDVFPLLLQINDRAIEHINESAGQLAVMNDFYEQQLKEACDSMVSKKEGRVILEISRFESLHPALKSGVARECIHLASGRLKDITSTHIGALVKLAGQQSGRKINLPYGIIAEKSFGEVILFAERCDDEKEEIHITQKELEVLSATGEQKNIKLSADGSYVTLCIQDFNGKMDEIPKKPYTKWFDYDKMKKGFEIRTRKAGDYIIVDDEGHHKKLKQVFTGDKIPAQQRAGLWLIAHESLVHAIIGYRSGCSALVTPQTGKVLKITFYGGKQNGFFKEI